MQRTTEKMNLIKCHCKYKYEACNGNFHRLVLNSNLCELIKTRVQPVTEVHL